MQRQFTPRQDEIEYGYCHCGCGEKTNVAPRTDTGTGWIKGEPLKYLRGHSNKNRIIDDPIGRFWSNVDIGDPDDCWEWMAGRYGNGYGQCRFNFEKRYSHRVAWELTNSEIEDGLEIMHTCDNPACCNPNHLRVGTHAENMADRDAKGRGNHGPLLKVQVLQIRSLCASGADKLEVASDFGVSYTCVTNIVNRVTWKHI